MYKDEKIIFIDTDTLTMEEQEEMIQEKNKNEQAKKLKNFVKNLQSSLSEF